MSCAETILHCLSRSRVATGTEAEMQAGVERVLGLSGLPFAREVRLTPKDRIDFLVAGGVGVELKIDGATSAVHRQLLRYAGSDRIHALVLVTTKAMHRQLPGELLGKPLHIYWQGGIG